MDGAILVIILWSGIGFLSGSLMFSLWLARLFVQRDAREYGDANPGAFNAWKAGGAKVGLPGALLDFAKGAAPVGLAVWSVGIAGWGLVPVVLAPVLGHAFSPFLGFKGGKAVAVTLGVWSGLTIWEGLGVLGVLMGIFALFIDNDSWSVMLALAAFGGYLLLRGGGVELLALWLGNLALLLAKHSGDLRAGFHARPLLAKIFGRRG